MVSDFEISSSLLPSSAAGWHDTSVALIPFCTLILFFFLNSHKPFCATFGFIFIPIINVVVW